MRIHSDYVTVSDIYALLRDGLTGVSVEVSRHGSRKRAAALEVRLEGTSTRRNMSNTGQAATWDEWGVFMARVFNLDANALLGHEDRAAFDERTQGRFDDLTMPEDAHGNHAWESAGARVQACKRCSAVQVW